MVFAFLGRELIEEGADFAPDGFFASSNCLSEQVFEFGEDLLDWVDVW